MWLKSPFCFVCQKEIKKFSECTLEHIFPKSLGGTDSKYNLGISHRRCNQLRGNTICRLVWQEKTINEIPMVRQKRTIKEIPNIEWKNRVYKWKVILGYIRPKHPENDNPATSRKITWDATPEKMEEAWNEKYNLTEEKI